MPKKPLLIFKFLGIAAAVFIVTFIVFYLVGAVPAEFQFFTETPTYQPPTISITATSTNGKPVTQSSQPVVVNGFFAGANFPERIIIPSISVNSVVLNPQTTDVVALDDLLLKGAVRYPTSGQLGQGTVFIFGHNTGLAAFNPAYKTFNGLRTIKNGAQIEVDSASARYFYTVTSLELVDSDTAYVNVSATDNELVIATCNVFGAKEQRYVVHAAPAGQSAL